MSENSPPRNPPCYAIVGVDPQTREKRVYFRAQPNNQNRLFHLIDGHDSDHTLRILCGGAIGGGKTKTLVGVVIWFAQRWAKCRIGVGRKDFNDLRDTFYADFVQLCPPGYIKQPQKLLADRLDASHRILFHNLSEILFLELKDVTGKLGLEFDLVVIEQAEEIPLETYQTMEGRLRRGMSTTEFIPRVMLLGANPNPGFTKTLFYDNHKRPPGPADAPIPEIPDPAETAEDRAAMAALGLPPTTVIDPDYLERYRHPYYHYLHFSPKHNVDLMRKNPHYVSDLQAKFSPSWVRRYLQGDWEITIEGAIYPEYDATKHEIAPFQPPRDWPRVMCLDPHLAKPFVASYYAQCPDGPGFIYDELIGTPEQGTRDFFRAMKRRERTHWPGGAVGTYRRIIDYSLITQQHKRNDGRTIREIAAEEGLAFENARKANKWDNILLVKAQLKPDGDSPPLLYTTTNCTEHCWQWRNYRWEEHEPGTSETERILKERDDAMDNVQYLIAIRPWATLVAPAGGPSVSYHAGADADARPQGGAPRIDEALETVGGRDVSYGVE